MTLDKRLVFTLPATNETVMKHTFRNIKYGGKYRVTIATDVDGAMTSQPVIYIAPPILPPHQVNVLYEEGNYIVYWQERGIPDTPSKDMDHYYEVLVNASGTIINESTAIINKVDQPPYIFHDAKTDTIYSFAVRLVTNEGYRSLLSEVISKASPICTYMIYFIIVERKIHL